MRPLKLIACIALPLAVGSISGFATMDGMRGWYDTLNAPTFRPPSWVFGPVWTTLYVLMGISLYRLLNAPPAEERTKAFLVFMLQLTLNFAWSFLFFMFHWLGIAFIEIVAMWLSILWMIRSLKKVDTTAAYLQIPYLLWVSFASILNGAYWWLNR